MAGARFTGGAHRIDAQTRGDVLQRRHARGRLNWQGRTSGKAHYNDLMLALRYVYIVALVVWLGGMVVLAALVEPTTVQVLQASAPETGRALADELFGVGPRPFPLSGVRGGGVLLIAWRSWRFWPAATGLCPPPGHHHTHAGGRVYSVSR